METHRLPSLTDVSSDRLTARLYELRVEERHRLVEFLAYLAELERRRLHLDLGFASAFAFCTDHLGLTKGAAYRRTTAARLADRFPIVADYLADGRLNLTTLVELRDVLCEERPDLLRRLPVPVAVPPATPPPAPPASSSGPNQLETSVSQPTLSPAHQPVKLAPIADERYVAPVRDHHRGSCG
jgi:hypothetical protein